MSNTATRLITLIMLLQRQPNQKALVLADQLGVSVRTVQRYIGMLEEMGIPVYAERGPYGGYALVPGYKMPPLVLGPEEAVAVYLGTSLVEEMWGQLYREAARGALAKLDNVLPVEQRHEVAWARRTLLATGMHRADLAALAPTLERLRRAAREHRRVRLTYRSRSQAQAERRDLDPYALVHRWGWWYVVGYCHLRHAVRIFRVDRILELALLDAVFELPANFDLRAFLATEPQTQPQVTAHMRLMPEAARAASEDRSYWDQVQEQSDGSAIVTFSAPSLEWAASTALMFGPAAEVLDPPELRRMVTHWAALVVERHRGKETL